MVDCRCRIVVTGGSLNGVLLRLRDGGNKFPAAMRETTCAQTSAMETSINQPKNPCLREAVTTLLPKTVSLNPPYMGDVGHPLVVGSGPSKLGSRPFGAAAAACRSFRGRAASDAVTASFENASRRA
jgi:hypothetical protein